MTERAVCPFIGGSIMKRYCTFAIAFLLLFLGAGCAKNDQVPDKVDTIVLESHPWEHGKQWDINALMNDLDAGGIWEMRYSNEDTLYLLAFRRDENKDGKLKMTVLRFNTNNNSVEVVYENRHSTDGANRMEVRHMSDGMDVVFSGQVILFIGDEGTEAFELADAYKRDARYSPAARQLVFVDPSHFDLHRFDIISEVDTVLYESNVPSDSGERRIPYLPYFNNDGTQILFQEIGETALHFKALILCDIAGNVLQKIHEEQFGESIYHFWNREHFLTFQSTDQPGAAKTVIHRYDQTGQKVLSIGIDQFIDGNLIRIAQESDILSFIASKEAGDAFGTVNLITGEVRELYQSASWLYQSAISPSGSKIVWIEDGMMREATIPTLLD